MTALAATMTKTAIAFTRMASPLLRRSSAATLVNTTQVPVKE
jgi:hypothetical protein